MSQTGGSISSAGAGAGAGGTGELSLGVSAGASTLMNPNIMSRGVSARSRMKPSH